MKIIFFSSPGWRKHLKALGRETIAMGNDWVDKSFT